MALSDRQRHDAYEALAATFADRTDLVIEMLRPAHDLATTADVTSATELLRRDLDEQMAALRHDLEAQIGGLRHDLEAMETRLTLATERMVHDAFAAQTRTLVFGLVGAFVLTALTNVLTVALG